MDTSHWTLKEKIGQLFIVAFGGEEMTQELEKAIADWNVGGVILFQRNLRDTKKVIELNAAIQNVAKKYNRPPLWISIDQEGGGISYLWDGMVLSPGNMVLGAGKSSENAYRAAHIMGTQLKQLGFNMNFAPVMDINNNPKNPVIGARSFSESPEEVSELAIQTIHGYHHAGMLAVGKHFPGHGDTEYDSHLSLPVVDKSLQALEAFELIPFQRAVQNGMEAVMTAHIVYPQLDKELPATLSSFFLKELLRKTYQFDGLIITDSMEMDAIAQYFGREEGSLRAIQAGADIILACGKDVESQEKMVNAVVAGVETGQINVGCIEESLSRVLRMKEGWINKDELDNLEHINIDEIPKHEYKETMIQIALEGITLQVDNKGYLPIPSSLKPSCTVISQRSYNDGSYMGDRTSIVKEVFATDGYDVTYIQGENPTTDEVEQLSKNVESGEYVLVFINERRKLHENWTALVEGFCDKTDRVIVVSLWNPQIVEHLPKEIAAYITSYSYTDQTLYALKELLEGSHAFKGQSPVTLLEQGSLSTSERANR